jgi:hypothetical protein
MIGTTKIGTSTIATGTFDFFGIRSPFYELFNGTQDLVILVDVEPYYRTIPFGSAPRFQWSFSYATSEWRDDTTGSSAYPMRLQNPMNFERQATGDDPFGSPGDNFSFGTLHINMDPDDEDIYSTEWTSEKLSLTIRDPDYALTEEIQKKKYTGLGHVEGGDRSEGGPNLKDVEKPLLYGYGRNVNPVLIDASWSVYQYHDGELEEIEEIFDGGYEYDAAEFDVGLDGSTNSVWDWGVTDGRSPTGGQWITHHEEGLMRLATRPAFTLTGNVKGAVTSARAYNQRIAYVVEAMMIDRLGITAADIIGVGAMDSVVPFDTGIYIRSGGITLDNAIQNILGPVQCFLGYTVRGEYELRALRRSSSTNKVIHAHEITNFKRLDSTPEAVDLLKFSYGHNWTVRSDDQLALNRSEEFAEFSENEDRWSKVSLQPWWDPSHSEKIREIKSFLLNESDAYSEVVRQYGLMIASDIYEITMTQRPLGFLPGDTINVFYDGYGFNNGKAMLALSVRENGRAGTTVLRVWGNYQYEWGL